MPVVKFKKQITNVKVLKVLADINGTMKLNIEPNLHLQPPTSNPEPITPLQILTFP